MKDEIKKLIEKSDHALEVAEKLMRDGYLADAVSKTYYAMFYVAQAVLKSDGIDVTKHSAVESSFGYAFAKTNRIDPQYHKMLINARKIREIADYDIQEEIIEPTANLTINDGKAFCKAVKELLK